MKKFNARQEILKYGKPFATHSGGYEILFEPHLLGSMVNIRGKKEELRGSWLLADAPAQFVLALGTAARKLNQSK